MTLKSSTRPRDICCNLLVVVLCLLSFFVFTTTTTTTTTTKKKSPSTIESNDEKRTSQQQQQQNQNKEHHSFYEFPQPPPPRTILLDSAEVSNYLRKYNEFRKFSKFNRLNATHYTETQLSNFDINFPDDEQMSLNRTLKKFNINDPEQSIINNKNNKNNNEKARKAMMMSGGPMYDGLGFGGSGDDSNDSNDAGDYEPDADASQRAEANTDPADNVNDDNDDDVDDEEKNSLYTLPAKVILSTLAATASLITICGNVLVMVSFFLDRQIRIPTNYFILSLAVSDFLIGLFSMPLYTLYLMLGRWPFGEIICNLWLSLDYTVCLTSIYTVLFITIDRFCSVKIPAKYRKWRSRNKIIIMVALTWIIPISLFFTAIFVGNYARKEKFNPKSCDVTWSSNFVFNFTLVVSYFWSTLLVMIVLYIFIYQVARNLERKSREKQRKLSSLVGCSASNTGALVGVVALPSNMSGVVKPMAVAGSVVGVGGGGGGGAGSSGDGPNDHHRHHHHNNANAQTPPDDIEEFDEDFNTDSQSKLSKGSIKRRKKDHMNFIKRTSKTTGIALVTAISGVAHGHGSDADAAGRSHGHKDKKHSAAAAAAAAANAKKYAQAAKCVNMNGPGAQAVAAAAAKRTSPSTAAATNAPAANSTTTFANSSAQTKGAANVSSLSSTGAWNGEKKPPPTTESNNNTNNSTITTTMVSTSTTTSASANKQTSTWGNNLNPTGRRLTGVVGGNNNNNKAFVSSSSSYSRCGVDLEDISSSYESHSDYDSSAAARSGRRRTNSDFEQNAIELSVTNNNNDNNTNNKTNNTSNTLRAYLGQRVSSSVDRKMSTIEAGEKLRHHHQLHLHHHTSPQQQQQQRQLNQLQQQQQQPQSLQPRPETLAVMSHDLFAEKCASASVKQLQQSSSKLFSVNDNKEPLGTDEKAAAAANNNNNNNNEETKQAIASAASEAAANGDGGGGGGELQAVEANENNNNNNDNNKFPSSSFKDQIPFIDEEFDDLSYILHRRQFDNEKVQIKEETILIKSPLKSSFFQKFSSPIKSFSRKSSQKAMAAAAAAAAAVAAVAQSAPDSAQETDKAKDKNNNNNETKAAAEPLLAMAASVTIAGAMQSTAMFTLASSSERDDITTTTTSQQQQQQQQQLASASNLNVITSNNNNNSNSISNNSATTPTTTANRISPSSTATMITTNVTFVGAVSTSTSLNNLKVPVTYEKQQSVQSNASIISSSGKQTQSSNNNNNNNNSAVVGGGGGNNGRLMGIGYEPLNPRVNRPMTKRKTKYENRARKALRTITFILGAFVICWSPFHVVSIYNSYCPSCEHSKIYQHFFNTCYFLCYLNSPINPFMYALANQQFRKTFFRILKGDWRKL